LRNSQILTATVLTRLNHLTNIFLAEMQQYGLT